MTTESLMIHAIKRGLLISDFQELSIGMILDYFYQYDQLCISKYQLEEGTMEAGQNEFNKF